MRSWIRSIQRVERVVEGPGLHRIEVWQYCNAEERTERTMTLQSFLAPLCNLSWLKENKATLKLHSLYYNIMYNIYIYIYDNTCLYIIYIYILYHCTLFVDALLVQSKWPRLQRLVNMAEIPPAVVGLWADIFHPVPRSLRRICEQHVPLWHVWCFWPAYISCMYRRWSDTAFCIVSTLAVCHAFLLRAGSMILNSLSWWFLRRFSKSVSPAKS